MKPLEVGEVIELDGDKEYIVLQAQNIDGIDYLYLVSNFKPLDVKFAKQEIINNEVQVTFVGDQEEKIKVLEHFSK